MRALAALMTILLLLSLLHDVTCCFARWPSSAPDLGFRSALACRPRPFLLELCFESILLANLTTASWPHFFRQHHAFFRHGYLCHHRIIWSAQLPNLAVTTALADCCCFSLVGSRFSCTFADTLSGACTFILAATSSPSRPPSHSLAVATCRRSWLCDHQQIDNLSPVCTTEQSHRPRLSDHSRLFGRKLLRSA